MSIKVKFPDFEEVELECGKSVVILGANGAGKTRFSTRIEELNDPRYSRYDDQEGLLIHRISAQNHWPLGMN